MRMRVAVVACLGSAALGSAAALAQEPASPPPVVDPAAETLFLEGCASCHGSGGTGTERGPSLAASGEASAYYYLSTGRMPLADPDEQPRRKEPAYSPEEIELLADYVASLGDGPSRPAVDVDTGDVAEGGRLYRANCQACHSASGAGGALSYGRAAPQLAPADPGEIAAAVRAGPGPMPVFGPGEIEDDELDDLVAYVEYLDDPADPGGLPIGRTGPIPEGFVAWLLGIGALLGFVWWIGTRSPSGSSGARRVSGLATDRTFEGGDES